MFRAIVLTSLSALAALSGCAAPTAVPSATGSPANGYRALAVEASSAQPVFTIPGMQDARYKPTNRSTYLAVSPDGKRVAVAWLHNEASAPYGEPNAYGVVGSADSAGSFGTPALIGRRTQPYAASVSNYHKKYNTAHNAPFVVADNRGGFLGLSVPMNANGYAQGHPATGFAYQAADCDPGFTTFSNPSPSRVARVSDGSSLSAMSGATDARGDVHLFGQGHLGQFQGGFGYQRRRAGATAWESVNLAEAYRPDGKYYFGEGSGYVSKLKNDRGRNDLHAAFAWNAQGESPMYGLYYLKSRDGGQTWTTAAGTPVSLPLRHRKNDGAAAVIRADLTSTRYGGEAAGHRSIDVSATPDGRPLIVRPRFTDASRKRVQHFLYTWAGGRWVSQKVGPSLFWDAAGNGVAYNAATRQVNVVLLDPGSASVPARVIRYSQSLDDAMGAREKWTATVIATVKTRTYASHLQVREVRDSHFVALFENHYVNPGRVEPMMLKVPMK